MRVLWFTNTFLAQAYPVFGLSQSHFGEGWTSALFDAWRRRDPRMEACLASQDHTGIGRAETVVSGNTTFARLPRATTVRDARKLIGDWRPDVIHIHGTEGVYSDIVSDAGIAGRAVVSLQGLVGPCSTWPAWFGNHTIWDIVKLHHPIEPFIGRGLVLQYFGFKKGVRRERRVLSSIRHVMGRTDFDRAYVTAINPSIVYHRGDELLRDAFWQVRWSLPECKRHSIFFTNAGHPRKGVEVLCEAFEIVRRRFPDAELRIAGHISTRNGYGLHVRRLLARTQGATLLGALDADAVASELSRAHVFASPSFIDNSPNALCESQLVGAPSVATYAGGVSSLVTDRKTGLLTPVGDASLMAMRIMELFENDELSSAISDAARDVARQRHDPDRVIAQLLEVYGSIAGDRASVEQQTVP